MNLVFQPKSLGGLGIKKVLFIHQALLTKMGWRIFQIYIYIMLLYLDMLSTCLMMILFYYKVGLRLLTRKIENPIRSGQKILVRAGF